METVVTVRMDADLKAQLEALCAQQGMTLSTACNLFAQAFVRAKEMPFTVTSEELAAARQENLLAEVNQVLEEFSEDYGRMAE